MKGKCIEERVALTGLPISYNSILGAIFFWAIPTSETSTFVRRNVRLNWFLDLLSSILDASSTPHASLFGSPFRTFAGTLYAGNFIGGIDG